jgi:hypothetical protein
LALGGRTVEEWQNVVSNREFRDWIAFYKAFPFDDHHRYHRPASLIVSQGNQDRLQASLEFLDINSVVSPELNIEGLSEADMSIIRALRG